MIASEYVWIYACACSMPKWWCTLCKRCTILFIWWAKNIKHSVWKDMRRGKSDSNTFRAPAFLSHFEKTWNDKFKLHSRAVTLFIWNSFIKIYFLCLFRFGNTVLLGKWTEKKWGKCLHSEYKILSAFEQKGSFIWNSFMENFHFNLQTTFSSFGNVCCY